MDESSLRKSKELFKKYGGIMLASGNLYFTLMAHNINMRKIVSATAMMSYAEEYYKRLGIRCELNKPFLQKLYEMSGRGY